MSKPTKPPLICLLGIDPAKSSKCKPSECAACGWEAAEAERRTQYIKEHGLTLCADGLRRLIMKKEENEMATPYKECPHCGAHLDSGETCDCTNAERHTRSTVPLETVVDIEKQTEANNRALNKIADFMME